MAEQGKKTQTTKGLEGHILLVEDSADLRALMRLALVNAGFGVSVVGHGREALDTLEKAERLPRLILLDLMMPVMSGWEFLEHREKHPTLREIPVIVLSAVRDGRPDGVLCLTKPVELPVLLEAVRENYGA